MFPTTVYDLGQAQLADLRRQARRDAPARAVRPSRPRTRPHAASSRAGTRLRWLAAALAAAIVGLVASAAAVPAAFARDMPPGLYGRSRVVPVPPATALARQKTVGVTEAGIAVALGVLLDTRLVRTVLVPATLLALDERAWWPTRRGDRRPKWGDGS
jgi:MMPL family